MVIREYISRVLILVVLLISSGDSRWPQAWIFFGLLTAMTFLFHLAVVIPDPDLYNERGVISDKSEKWDRLLLAAYALNGYLAILAMGLDHRLGWTSMSDFWFIPGAILMALSFTLSAWSMRVNHFFSSVVRVQDDRGHHVCDRGPYSVIRHPGYFSGFLYYLGSPLMIGSLLGFLFTIINISIFVYRIKREEQVLGTGLAGYEAYHKKVRYRLLPGVW